MMNERIIELEAQCWEPRKHPISQAALGDKFNTEKFAELIVKECISIIENAENGYQDYRNQIEDAMRDHCVWLIKHKFGVEE